MKRSICTLLFMIPVLAGCGGDDRVAAVHGIVKLDGDPVADASVTFMPKEGGRPAFGITNAEGAFELTTFESGDGALIGRHVVTIMAVDETTNSKAEALAEEHGSLAEVMHPRSMTKQEWRIPPRYSEDDSSGLEFEVVRGADNQADFLLSTKP